MASTHGNPVMHFETGCRHLEKTSAFYAELFGWTPTVVPFAALLETNSTQGIQGHITALGHEPHNYVTVYIEVEDINQSLENIGGKKIIVPVPLPNESQFAWFNDPEGNMPGLRTKAV